MPCFSTIFLAVFVANREWRKWRAAQYLARKKALRWPGRVLVRA